MLEWRSSSRLALSESALRGSKHRRTAEQHRPGSAYEIANLFGDEVLTSVKRRIDVLKLDRHGLVLPKPWARLKLIVQVWSECVSRVPQPSNYLARGDAVTHFDSDGARLHVHHHAVLGVAMVDDHAIAGRRIYRVM